MSPNNSQRTTADCHTQRRAYPDSRLHLLGVDMAPSNRQYSPINCPLDDDQLHGEEEYGSEDENVDFPSYTQPRPQIGVVPGTSVFSRSRISFI